MQHILSTLFGGCEYFESARVVDLYDGDSVLATPGQLSGAKVTADVVDQVRGDKIEGFTYKSKTNQRRRWGHRQNYNTITITGISKG